MTRPASWRWAAAALALALGPILPTPASAGTYAAMESVPVTGGELRLAASYSGPRGSQEEGVAAGGSVIAFPLKHTAVDIRVDGVMARVTVEQLFANPFDDPLEATYLFPLDDESAVHAYEIAFADRVVKGVVKERAQARQEYETARDDGKVAGLLEQQKDDVFEQSIANIPPHEDVRVRLTYVQLVDHDDEGWELAFPLVVGPRFLPPSTTDRHPIIGLPAGRQGPAGAKTIPYLAPTTRSGHDVEIAATIDPGVPVTAVDCPSHRVTRKDVDATTIRVELDASDSLPNKDFVLRWSTAADTTRVGVLTHRSDDDGYVTLVIQPKADYRTGDIAPREILVVLDASGSMNGQPLALAQALARRIVGSAADADTVNVFRYSDGVTSASPDPLRADEAGMRQALAFVDSMQSGGGTMMNDAVMHAFGTRPDDGRTRMIYLITDGFIGNDADVLDTVARTTAYNRISAIGIGSAPNRYLIDRIAEIGRGVSATCGLSDSPDAVADDVIRHTAFPHLTDVAIDWDGLRVKDVVPEVLPDVLAGKPLVVSARYEDAGRGTVRVSARQAGRPVEVELDVELPEKEERPGVEMLWARRRVKELMNASHGPRADLSRIESDVTKIGLRHQLVTEFTSFVAVDDSERRVLGQLVRVAQPLEMPEGMSWEGTFGPSGSPSGSPGAPYAPPSSSAAAYRPSRSSGGLFSGGGLGGDVDPITMGGVAAFLVLVVLLKRRASA